MSWWFGRRKKKILTLGSVHLDTIAKGHLRDPDTLETCAGEITHSIGGSAYNLAANLARHQPNRKYIRDVAIYTILPKHSVVTEMIRFKLRQAKVNTKYARTLEQFEGNRVRGGGFVAILDMNLPDLRLAVIDAALGKKNIFQDDDEKDWINSALDWADYLVADCNLSCVVLDHIAEHAQTHEKPLFVSLGSDEQIASENWLEGEKGKMAVCAGGHSHIICKLLQHQRVPGDQIDALTRFVSNGEGPGRVDVGRLCKELRARYVLCHSLGGFALLAGRENDPQALFIPVKNEKHVGIVDAALSGFITTYARSTRRKDGISGFDRLNLRHPTFQATLKHNIGHFVRDSAHTEGATPNSLISFEEDTKEQGALATLRRTASIFLDNFPTTSKAVSAAVSGLVAAALIHQNWPYILYWVKYIRSAV